MPVSALFSLPVVTIMVLVLFGHLTRAAPMPQRLFRRIRDIFRHVTDTWPGHRAWPRPKRQRNGHGRRRLGVPRDRAARVREPGRRRPRESVRPAISPDPRADRM